MKKMFLIFLAVTASIVFLFLFFSSDINILNTRFLEDFGIETSPECLYEETFTIPLEFDSIYQNYNLVQLEAGFDLSSYKGLKAVRYTYKMLNFPNSESENIYANVICVKNRQVGGDICCTDLDGFILPLNFFKTNKFDYRPTAKYHIPARNDAPIP